MIVDTMTSEELYREIKKELNDVGRDRVKRKFLHKVKTKALRDSIKKDNYLYLFPVEEGKGESCVFYALPFTFGKKHYLKYGVSLTYGIFANYRGHKYCFKTAKGNVIAISVHAVKRYLLRAKNPTIKSNDYKKIALSFMLFSSWSLEYLENGRLFAVTPDGVFLGVEKEGIRIVKTYISFEMLRDYQKPLVKQLISDAIVDLSLDFTRGDVNAEYRDYFLIKFYESQESLDLV